MSDRVVLSTPQGAGEIYIKNYNKAGVNRVETLDPERSGGEFSIEFGTEFEGRD